MRNTQRLRRHGVIWGGGVSGGGAVCGQDGGRRQGGQKAQGAGPGPLPGRHSPGSAAPGPSTLSLTPSSCRGGLAHGHSLPDRAASRSKRHQPRVAHMTPRQPVAPGLGLDADKLRRRRRRRRQMKAAAARRARLLDWGADEGIDDGR